MPRPIATADRQLIHRLARQGLSASVIAQRLKISPRSVWRLLGRPAEQLAPSYEQCGRPVDPSRPGWRQAAAALRREHPHWGAQRLLLDLAKQPLPGTPPPLRTLQRWLAQTDLPPAAPGRRPAERLPRAQQPHERWQMDAMDQVRLGDGRQASCLRIVDECSGAPLGARVFPPGQLGPSAGLPDASDTACVVCLLGNAPSDAGGQRHALGFVR
jgi:Homeodomain-like domain-containing protein